MEALIKLAVTWVDPLIIYYTLAIEMNMNNRVKVGVRIRPLVQNEINTDSLSVVSASRDKSSVILNIPSRKNQFDYDWVFGQDSSQKEIYESVCSSLIDSLFEGINATVFACKMILKSEFLNKYTLFYSL